MNAETMTTAIVITFILAFTTTMVVERVIQHRETELSYQSERDCAIPWQPPTIPNCDDATWDRIINGCEEQD